VRVSRVALHKFLKKYGLDHVPTPAARPADPQPAAPLPPPGAAPAVPAAPPAPPFCSGTRSTPAPSC
jgi:hypothetical protein